MMKNTFLQLEYFNLNSLESPKRPRFLVLSVIRAYENWRLSRKLEVKNDNQTISLMRRLVTQLLFNLQFQYIAEPFANYPFFWAMYRLKLTIYLISLAM